MRPRVNDPSGNFVADWNFVDEANEVLNIEGGNSFCSSHWDPERVDAGGIGEVRQLFYPASQSRMPGFLTGAKHCGSDQQWSQGYFADAPSVVYLGGVPTCCAPDGAEFNEDFDFGFFS
jgi:hypothetical protein